MLCAIALMEGSMTLAVSGEPLGAVGVGTGSSRRSTGKEVGTRVRQSATWELLTGAE